MNLTLTQGQADALLTVLFHVGGETLGPRGLIIDLINQLEQNGARFTQELIDPTVPSRVYLVNSEGEPVSQEIRDIITYLNTI